MERFKLLGELSQMMQRAFNQIVEGNIDIDQKLVKRLPSMPDKNYADDDLEDVFDLLAQSSMWRETRLFELRSARYAQVRNKANG